MQELSIKAETIIGALVALVVVAGVSFGVFELVYFTCRFQ